ncbi:glycosyltransferase family 39 protein [Pseudomonadota bacterium]
MPLWGDEVMLALNFLDRTPGNILDPLENGQVAPPLFIFTSWLVVQYIGNSEWLLRFIPTIASVAALLLMYRLTVKTLGREQALIAVGLLAVSYYTIRYGAEFKPYSLDLLMSLIVLFVGYQYREAPSNKLRTFTFISVLPLATFASFPVVFVVGSVLFALCVDGISRKAWRQLSTAMLAGTLTLVLFSINYFYFIQIHSTENIILKTIWQDAFPPKDLIGFFAWFIEQSSGRIMAYPHGGGNYKSLLTFLLALGGAGVLWRQGRHFFTTLLVMPFLLTVLAAIFHAYPYGSSARIAQHLAPSICILAAVGLTSLFTGLANTASKYQVCVRGICYFLLVLGLLGIGYSIYKPYKSTGDLEVRRVVDDFFQEFGCTHVSVPNAASRVPVNFRWYLSVSERAVFNARIETNLDPGIQQICILYFDSNNFPVQTMQLNKQIQALSKRMDVKLDLEKSIQIYGSNELSHLYRQVILAQQKS